jgi:hypothetical protein
MPEVRPLTREVDAALVLRVIAEIHRQRTYFDPEVDPSAELSFRSTIADWRSACDLLHWRELGRALGMEWGINATAAEWRAVLEPARERTLGDVCQFIADRAHLPQIVARGFFGARCATAGLFFGVRSALAAEGIETKRLRPSSDMEPYLRLAPFTLLTFGARTAPGRLPPLQIERGLWVRNRRVSLGTLRTFRDYADCLAGGIV